MITLPARWIIFNWTPLLKINPESINAYTLNCMLKPCHRPYQRCLTTQPYELITTYLHSSQQLSRNMSLVIGLTRYVALVRRQTLRTRPSRPMLKSPTHPKGHAPRGAFSSMINTTSPTLRFGFFSNHFWRWFSSTRYSVTQRYQKCLTMICAWRHCLRYASALCVAAQGKE